MTEKKPNIHEMGWDEFKKLSDIVLSLVVASGYQPEIILGVLRGGFHLAEYLSKKLEIQSSYVRIRRTTNNSVFAEKGRPYVVAEESNYQNRLQNSRVLVVDDIATYGETLRKAVSLSIEEKASNVQTATLIRHKPETTGAQEINYYAYVCEPDDWFIFPWEVGEDYR